MTTCAVLIGSVPRGSQVAGMLMFYCELRILRAGRVGRVLQVCCAPVIEMSAVLGCCHMKR